MSLVSTLRRGLAALAILGVGASTAVAQAGGTAVTGTVTDAASGRPIDGVRVQVAGTALQGVSDARGVYRIVNVTAGEVRLQARRVGYRAMEKTVTASAARVSTASTTLADDEATSPAQSIAAPTGKMPAAKDFANR